MADLLLQVVADFCLWPWRRIKGGISVIAGLDYKEGRCVLTDDIL
jgi:hypothetical protein